MRPAGGRQLQARGVGAGPATSAGCRTRSCLHVGDNAAERGGDTRSRASGGGTRLRRVSGLWGKWESTWLWRAGSFVGSAGPGMVARGQGSKSRRPGESDTSGRWLFFLTTRLGPAEGSYLTADLPGDVSRQLRPRAAGNMFPETCQFFHCAAGGSLLVCPRRPAGRTPN